LRRIGKMGAVQVATSVTALTTGQRGHVALSLDSISGSSVPTVLAGSCIEVAGALFEWTSDETPQATTWTAIATGSTVYMRCIPSGSAGSQILITNYMDTAPTWVDSKQGWYASVGSSARVIGKLYKYSATEYVAKQVFDRGHLVQNMNLSIQIGEWNMDAISMVTVPLPTGINDKVVRGIDVVIRPDEGDFLYKMDIWNAMVVGAMRVDSGSTVSLFRFAGGLFDDTAFNATASTVANRGFITITYGAGGTP
jgi:hypothetical protein